jgi:hypothetical protein
MTWVAVAVGGSAVIGAGASIYGGQQAANAQQDASKQGLQFQQNALNAQYAMNEPYRQTGHQALGDLNAFYGYTSAPYTPLSQLQSGQFGQSIGVNGRSGKDGNAALQLGSWGAFGGGQDKKFGGTINPLTGTVDITHGGKKEAEREALLTNYLRTGEGGDLLGNKYNRFTNQIDRLRNSGWEYDPNAQATANAQPGAGAPPATQQSMFDRLQNMPGFQFGLSQGTQALDRSAAARSGPTSGNSMRAAMQFGTDYGGTKFNEEFNRLAALAGIGQTASNNNSNAAGNYANNATNLAQAQGDARASGIVTGINGATNALGTGLQNWMLYRGGYFNRPMGA